MQIAVDFDGTLVSDDREYDDLATSLVFLPGAKAALEALRRAGHVLILFSGRANRALREDWKLNPLWRQDPTFDVPAWERDKSLNQARYEQMLAFVNLQLPGVFAFVDDGAQGKVSADLFIDDRALRFSFPIGWEEIAVTYGEAEG